MFARVTYIVQSAPMSVVRPKDTQTRTFPIKKTTSESIFSAS